MAKENEIYEKLKTKFPEEAYGTDKSRGFSLDTIDAYYVIERLNEVFGLCGEYWWLDNVEWIKIKGEKNLIICSALFCYIKSKDSKISQFPCIGGHQVVKDRWDDAYKSAMTNCICKGASFLGVGLDVYKGEFDGKAKKEIKEEPEEEIRTAPKTSGKGISPKQKEKLSQIAKSKYLKTNEKTKIEKIISDNEWQGCNKAIKWWFGEDWLGGERQRRYYVDLYTKSATKDMGEPQAELLANIELEANEKIKKLEPDKIQILINELKNNLSEE